MQSYHYFVILSRKAMEQYVFDLPHVCISVRDPGTDKVKLPYNFTRLDTLYLEFSDVNKECEANNIISFNEEHVKEILDFYSKYIKKVDGFLINCEAGISRSAGIGAALAKISNYEDNLFFKHFLPNSKVYTMLLNGYSKNAN